jgi:hypothetical protein
VDRVAKLRGELGEDLDSLSWSGERGDRDVGECRKMVADLVSSSVLRIAVGPAVYASTTLRYANVGLAATRARSSFRVFHTRSGRWPAEKYAVAQVSLMCCVAYCCASRNACCLSMQDA